MINLHSSNIPCILQHVWQKICRLTELSGASNSTVGHAKCGIYCQVESPQILQIPYPQSQYSERNS